MLPPPHDADGDGCLEIADKVRLSAPRRPPESWTDGGLYADFNMALAAAVQNLYYTGNE